MNSEDEKPMWNDNISQETQKTVEEQTKDVVNHPSHYNQYQGFEVIDVCEQLRSPDGSGNYNRGNAFKYLARAGWKNPQKEVEDLEKARFYIQREIDRLGRKTLLDDPAVPLSVKYPAAAPALKKASDAIRAGAGAAFTVHRCHFCRTRLRATGIKGVFECINGHGKLYLGAFSDSEGDVPKNEPLVRGRCPECETKLVSGDEGLACVHRHGILLAGDDDLQWASHICLQCKSKLISWSDDESILGCPNRCGVMLFPQHEPNGVWKKLTNLSVASRTRGYTVRDNDESTDRPVVDFKGYYPYRTKAQNERDNAV